MLLTIIRIRVHYWVMIICVCKAVSDRHIRAAVQDGASCMRDLTRRLSVGTCCGKCVPEARSVMNAHLDRRAESTCSPLFAGPSPEFAV